MTFAVAAQPISAPIYVAMDKGFFDREGLHVTLQTHFLGREALASVMQCRAQFATVADTPLAFAALEGKGFFIISTIAHSNRYAVITARKSRGIASPKDLQEKVIAISKGTTSDYFLHSYVTFYQLAAGRIKTVDINQDRITAAFSNGDIDAAVTFPPFTLEQQKILGSDSITLANEHIYRVTWNVAAEQDFVKSHPETTTKVLRALRNAQRFIVENPEEAQNIVKQHVGAGAGALRDFTFDDLRMDRALLTSLEEQARWAIKYRLTSKREVPNYLDVIYPGAMESVAPESVALTYR